MTTSGAELPFRKRFGYGIGDLSFNLYFTTASLYLLLYYTDVVGLSPATGGWIFAAALTWDAVLDPFMGYVASRTRTRWGSYRPYLLFGAVPLAIAWALIFLPSGFTGTALTIYALAVHMLFRTCYTIVSMPYLSLSAVMTSESNERGVLASFRMVAATGAGLIISYFTLDLVKAFGGGDQMRGFLFVALLFGTLATLILWFTFLNTTEEVAAEEEKLPSAADMIRMLRANSAFWLVGGLMLMTAMASTFFSKAIPYLFKYGVGRPDLIGTALATITGCAMISIPFWTQIMKRTSKRAVAMSGPSLGCIAYTSFWFVPMDRPDLLLGILVISGFATGAGYLTFWAMIPDTVEFGEWRTGVRAEGMLFGFVSLVQKAALGFGVGLLGEVLTKIGYVANQPQTPETLANLRMMMLAAPLAFAAAAVALISFYPLDRKRHARLVKALAWRNRRMSPRDVM
ncbi:MFS transporter [Novosphingobium lindaniclasticum]|uniref:Glycoside transporter n=1 Tax=Novosphingobium lindaniclasticum LE124 TaxID=1096930 RepID=T0J4H0_9SPHN|nr:glycoside-pentoside-hexuronide (GPH):cation symporter [Novosphingobium lindaniclasticum]EQB16834.1 hypothetical protein L284_09065 [Novosphingobium lindaniclasticum LE124]